MEISAHSSGVEISTHTLTWSVTERGKFRRRNDKNFNSHAHVERDADIDQMSGEEFEISTHTLTWSVTLTQYTNVLFL